MQSRLLPIAAIVFSLLLSPHLFAEQYALLVGVKQYRRTELTPLKYTENDVTAIAKTLKKRGYKETNVVLMTQAVGANETHLLPTSDNIREQFELLLRDRTPSDTVLVAFTGHGLQFKGQGEHYFCPADARVKKKDTLVSLTKIFSDLEKCRASGKVLLVDACRDDPLAERAKSSGRIELEAISNRPPSVLEGGTVALFSCAKSQKSYEDEELGQGHGVFFYYVNEALAGDSDAGGSGRSVTFDDLKKYASVKTKDYVRAAFSESQTPSFRSPKDSQDIVLIQGTGPKETVVNNYGMKLKLIQRGGFSMGTDPNTKGAKSNEALHNVEITKSFYLGATEVTQHQWSSIMNSQPWEERAHENFPMYESNPRNPASYIKWDEANEFCRRLSKKEDRVYRLPTEAEWEYACRANRWSKYSYGNDKSLLSEHAWFHDRNNANKPIADKAPQEVAKKKPNGFGLYDMHGNVHEWCSDWMDRKYYSTSESTIDPQGPDSGTQRVMRGGAFSTRAENCRSAHRSQFAPDVSSAHIGFRVVLELESDKK